MFRWIKKHRLLSVFLFLFLFLLSLYLLRNPILRGIGDFLIYEDKPEKTEVAFVLSGEPYDRPRKAAELYRKNLVSHFVCTSELIRDEFKVLRLDINEAENTKRGLLFFGVPDSVIELIPSGTSTYEEGLLIKDYCKTHHLNRCMIISSAFHTRRIHYIFGKIFKGENIQLIIQPATPSEYRTDLWWKNEQGLIDVDNEYMKLIYYWWKY